MMLVEPVVNEVRESAGLAADSSLAWINAIERGLMIDADPDQLFRILLNLVRNAAQALENQPNHDGAPPQIRVTGRREGAVTILEVSDTGPRRTGQGARASVRGVPRLGAARRLWARPCHCGGAGAGAWRRHSSGRRYAGRDVPHHAAGSSGGVAQCAQRTRAGLIGDFAGREKTIIGLSCKLGLGSCFFLAGALPIRAGAGSYGALSRRIVFMTRSHSPATSARPLFASICFANMISAMIAPRAPVAQLDRALDYESRGQEFESLRARQLRT